LVAGTEEVGSLTRAREPHIGTLGGREWITDHMRRVGRLTLRWEWMRHIRQAQLAGVDLLAPAHTLPAIGQPQRRLLAL